jgi:hypothetical protein
MHLASRMKGCGVKVSRAVGVALLALGVSACLPEDSPQTSSPANESPTSQVGPSTSPTLSTSMSPSPSASPSPSPDGPHPTGAITGAPAGAPVTPEIFWYDVDPDGGVLTVIVFVPGIYEDGGSCTVLVEGQLGTILKEQKGAADVTSTACGQFTFSLSQLGSGKATVTAGYESSKHSGTSEAVEVTIP